MYNTKSYINNIYKFFDLKTKFSLYSVVHFEQ